MNELPVVAVLPEIIGAVAASIPLVLKAPPGAGKTTMVPPAIIRADACGKGKVLLVQPRRLAARSSAARLAHLMNATLGNEVGYHVRFDNQTCAATRLVVMTTGILLRQLQHDPLLQDVSCVMLDEFHERSLEIDLALGMLQRIRTTLRPELRIVVMSATLDPEPIVNFLGDAKAVISEGRAYPVDVRYAKLPAREKIDRQVVDALTDAFASTSGHVLVFLPGVGEIRKTALAIESSRFTRHCEVRMLYGDMPPADQDDVLKDSPLRKIILATNIAETSVTIPGVTAVIDSGQARVIRFDTNLGLPKLQLEPISRASADQRAGRAGRTAPGVCFRLWPATTHHARRVDDTPEVLRGDFSSAMLTLAAWGERDVLAFPWLTPPMSEGIDNARSLLIRLSAIDQHNRLTRIGERMANLSLHPRMARMLVDAKRLGIVDDAAVAIALLTERDPFRDTSGLQGRSVTSQRCDVTDRVERMKTPDAPRSHAAASHVRRVAQQVRKMIATDRSDETSNRIDDGLKRSLLAGYPDRVAKLRTGNDSRGVMVGGKGVRLDASSAARGSELFLCIDVDSAGTDANVRMASAIDESWLEADRISIADEHFFNPTLKAIVTRRRRYYEDLMLSETPVACVPGPEVADLLYRQAKQSPVAIFPGDNSEAKAFVDRIRFLHRHQIDVSLPTLADDIVDDLLRSMCQNRTTMDELRRAPWLDHLRGMFSYEQLQWIDRHAPATMRLPSGNMVTVMYDEHKPPIVLARIQELFGWKQSPRIAGGKVPVQLHLLGPNHRPQQVTEDLENFWKVTYAVVRGELKRRYPKHYWPEDPLTATATANGLKPKT